MSTANNVRKTFTYGDTQLTVERRTVLSNGRYLALLNRMSSVFDLLAEALGEQSSGVDFALSQFARLAAQTREAVNCPVDILALWTMDKSVLLETCKFYLTEGDPRLLDAWIQAVADVDATWNAPELQPEPPEDLPKKM